MGTWQKIQPVQEGNEEGCIPNKLQLPFRRQPPPGEWIDCFEEKLDTSLSSHTLDSIHTSYTSSKITRERNKANGLLTCHEQTISSRMVCSTILQQGYSIRRAWTTFWHGFGLLCAVVQSDSTNHRPTGERKMLP